MATTIPQNDASFVLGEIAASCQGRIEPALSGKRVRGVVTDSRALQPGQLYVALRGERFDGHAFLKQAHERGAAAAIVESAELAPPGLPLVIVANARRALGDLALQHRVRWGKKVVAITGSAGKTTTKELTAAALEALGQRVLRTHGNLNNDIGLPMTLLCLTPQHDVAVVEIGTSGPGEIARLAQIARVDVGVVTTVSLAHTAGLGSLSAVADEKCALLRGLSKDGVAIYGSDTEVLRDRVSTFGGASTLAFGRTAPAHVQLLRHTLGASLTTRATYRVAGRATPLDVELGLCGIGPAQDAAAALAVVLALHGVTSLEPAARGLSTVPAPAGRLSPEAGVFGSLLVDDTYNANPASMLASLHTLSELAAVRGGAAIAALGDMAELGEHARAEHERVGRDAVRLGLSALFLCGTEMEHAATAARIEANGRALAQPLHIEHFTEPSACIPALRELLRAQAGQHVALLVKGSRSMAMERVVAALRADASQPEAGGDR